MPHKHDDCKTPTGGFCTSGRLTDFCGDSCNDEHCVDLGHCGCNCHSGKTCTCGYSWARMEKEIMATKKQKREAALAKRAAFEAKVKAEGLKALARARAHEAISWEWYNEQAEKQQAKLAPVLEFTDEDLTRARRLATALFIGSPVED